MISKALIFTLCILGSRAFEFNYGVSADVDPCQNEESGSTEFAEFGFYFVTEFTNFIDPIKVGAVINVPCDKLEHFMFSLSGIEKTATVTIKKSGSAMETFTNGAAFENSPRSYEEMMKGFNEQMEKLEGAVVSTTVDMKPDSVRLTLHTASSAILNPLEEYGVQYDPESSKFELDDSMLLALEQKKQEMEQKAKQGDVSQILTQELLQKLANGQNDIIQIGQNGQKIQIHVQRQIQVINPDDNQTGQKMVL